MSKNSFRNRIGAERGMARLVGIMLLLAALLALVVLGVPLYHYFADRSRAYGCGAALATANEQLRTYYLTGSSKISQEEARAIVEKAMDGWDDLCPGGGDCYIVATGDSDAPYEVVCALHDDDPEEAALLNAKSALAQLNALAAEEAATAPLSVTLNGTEYPVTEDPEETVIRVTQKELKDAGGTLLSCHRNEAGELLWFCYTDENRICIWDSDRSTDQGYSYGWTLRQA